MLVFRIFERVNFGDEIISPLEISGGGVIKALEAELLFDATFSLDVCLGEFFPFRLNLAEFVRADRRFNVGELLFQSVDSALKRLHLLKGSFVISQRLFRLGDRDRNLAIDQNLGSVRNERNRLRTLVQKLVDLKRFGEFFVAGGDCVVESAPFALQLGELVDQVQLARVRFQLVNRRRKS